MFILCVCLLSCTVRTDMSVHNCCLRRSDLRLPTCPVPSLWWRCSVRSWMTHAWMDKCWSSIMERVYKSGQGIYDINTPSQEYDGWCEIPECCWNAGEYIWRWRFLIFCWRYKSGPCLKSNVEIGFGLRDWIGIRGVGFMGISVDCIEDWDHWDKVVDRDNLGEEVSYVVIAWFPGCGELVLSNTIA